MRLLKIQPEIHKFDTFKEFAVEFKIGKGDLLFTHDFLFDNYMKSFDPPQNQLPPFAA